MNRARTPHSPSSLPLRRHSRALGTRRPLARRCRPGWDAPALQAFDHFPNALWPSWSYFEQTGHEAAAFEAARRAAAKSLLPNVMYYYVVGLYRRRDLETALDLLDRRKPGDDLLNDIMRAYLLAERTKDGPAQARAADQELARRYPKWDMPLRSLTVLHLLGDKAEAVTAARQLRQQGHGLPVGASAFQKRLLDYVCDDLSADRLVQAAGASRWDQCMAHFCIGLVRLAEGDRDGARDHFRRAVATRNFIYFEYDWSRSFLDRMEQDKKWPRWIPPKK